MAKKDYLRTNIKIYIDGLLVTNVNPEALIFGASESNSKELLKRYNPFSGEITLTKKQLKRLIKHIKINTD